MAPCHVIAGLRFAQSYIPDFLFSKKRPIQFLILRTHLKICIRYFGEVNIKLIFIQQLLQVDVSVPQGHQWR